MGQDRRAIETTDDMIMVFTEESHVLIPKDEYENAGEEEEDE